MATHVLVTGFPGFIAKRVVDRLIAQDPEATFTLLIQEQMMTTAETAISWIERRHAGVRDRLELVAGDISQQRLGLGKGRYDKETARTTHVWHLAAIYDLSVGVAVAYRVNVIGTANIADFCERCSKFQRLDYVSTCYVSGDRGGTILESELDEGQGFKNHYESTKCWAEMEVRRRSYRLPSCIHRPGIVVGDSVSGETDKYDGPYFVIKLLMRLPRWMPMVNIGSGESSVNLVPVNFLVDGMTEVWKKKAAIGETIQWADPNPYQAKEIVAKILEILGRRPALGSVPTKAVSAALGVEKLRRLVKLPQEAVIYFHHEAVYDTAVQQRLLRGTKIKCPDLMNYLSTLVDYVERHPDVDFLDGREI